MTYIEKESQIRFEIASIENAVNEAAKKLNAIWLSLIFLSTYVFISTGKITHKDLFFESPVKLPILGVDVPLRGFFFFVPIFIVGLHYYFSVQLFGLAEKFREYDRTTFDLDIPPESYDQIRIRQRLDNSVFAKILGAPSGRPELLLRIVGWASMAIMPPTVLLFIQLTYLPNQDSTITNWHRILLVLDALLVLVYVMPKILFRNSPRLQRFESEKYFRWILRVLRDSGWPDVLIVSLSAFIALWFSFFVAIFPWENSLFFELERSWLMAEPNLVRRGPSTWFSNRLVLSDLNLVEDINLEKTEVSRVARDRKFLFAIFDRVDLRKTDFTGSDLSFSSFNGAKLQKVKFTCAYQLGDENGGCSVLNGASFDNADLRDATLDGAIMYGASLVAANLNRASLNEAQMQGASLNTAMLDAANLYLSGLDGATLSNASLVGANLSYSRLRGANLSEAILFGADLDNALAQNSNFEGAQLQGSSLKYAKLGNANLVAVENYGANSENADFGNARIVNILSTPMWKRSYGWGYFYSHPFNDPFAMQGDTGTETSYDVPAPEDTEKPDYFNKFDPIPKSSSEIFERLFPEGLPSQEMSNAVRGRISRLGQNAATSDWKVIGDTQATKANFETALGFRLVSIACAKTGGGEVVRGLIKNYSLCPYRKIINATIKSGQRPDGPTCENILEIRRSLDLWQICPIAKGGH